MLDSPETVRSRLVGEDYADDSRLAARQGIYTWQQPKIDLQAQVLDLLSTASGAVVDVGCGNGRYVRALRSGRPDLRVLGLDLSPGMRPDAVADVQQLPLADRSAGAVLSMHMLYCVPDISVGVGELARVLRRDGVVIASTNSRDSHAEIYDLWNHSATAVIGGPAPPWSMPNQRFSLEAAPEILGASFQDVQLIEFPSVVSVPTPEPVVAYLDSARADLIRLLPPDVPWAEVLDAAHRRVSATIADRGGFTISCGTGILTGRRPR